MIGFVIGTVCLVLLVATVRRRHVHPASCHAGSGGAWGPGPRPFGGPPGFRPPWFHGAGSRRLLRGLFERLETTPGQEKAIVEEADKLRHAIRDGRKELRASREDLARAIGGEVFDEAALAAAFAKHDAAMNRMREVGAGALAHLHEVLDDEQRRTLAEAIGDGFSPRRWGGPYRAGY